MQVSNSVNIWLLILIKVNLAWPNAGLTLDVLIDYFYLSNCASWSDWTGDLALKVWVKALEFQCLTYLQHSEIIEEYNTHNCSLLGPCCQSVQHHWMNCRYGTEWAGLYKNSKGHIAPSEISWTWRHWFPSFCEEGRRLRNVRCPGQGERFPNMRCRWVPLMDIRPPACSPPEASPMSAGLREMLPPNRICTVRCVGKLQQSIIVGNPLSGWVSCYLVLTWCFCSIPKHSRSVHAKTFLALSPHWF